MFRRYVALIGLACGLGAMGWARPYLNCSLESAGVIALGFVFVAAFAIAFAAVGAPKVLHPNGSRWSRILVVVGISARVAAGIVVGVAATWGMSYWVERFGAYAIPRADSAGLALSILAIALGSASIRPRGRVGMTAAAAIFLGGFVLVTAYLADRLAQSPYYKVRKFAAAAGRADQEAMKPLFSRESLEHWGDLHTVTSAKGQVLATVDHMYPGVAQWAVIESVQVEPRTTAFVELLLPSYWHLFGGAGHSEDIALVQDNGAWKIDGYGEYVSSAGEITRFILAAEQRETPTYPSVKRHAASDRHHPKPGTKPRRHSTGRASLPNKKLGPSAPTASGASSEALARALAESYVRVTGRLSDVDFLLRGESLEIGTKGGGGFPLSAFERLFLASDGRLVRVRGPKDLVGRVRIQSPQQALQYVRLFTSPATVRALAPAIETTSGKRWLEVVPVTAINSDFVYGQSDLAKGLKRVDGRSRNRAFGVLTEAEWRKSGLAPPSVRGIEGGFVVTRFLFTVDEYQDFETSTVHRVAETVLADGRYHRQILDTRKLTGVVLVVWPEE